MTKDDAAAEAAWRRSFTHVAHTCRLDSTKRFCLDWTVGA